MKGGVNLSTGFFHKYWGGWHLGNLFTTRYVNLSSLFTIHKFDRGRYV